LKDIIEAQLTPEKRIDETSIGKRLHQSALTNYIISDIDNLNRLDFQLLEKQKTDIKKLDKNEMHALVLKDDSWKKFVKGNQYLIVHWVNYDIRTMKLLI